MQVFDISAIRARFASLSERANESLGSYDNRSLGIGRYTVGSSPWERHPNGDELLLVTDGELEIEVLQADGSAERAVIPEGGLFVVPRAHWHQLTAKQSVTVFYASPSDGAERRRDRPALP